MRFALVVVALFSFVVYGHAGSKGQAAIAPVTKGQDAGKTDAKPALELVRIGKVKWKRRPVVITECPICTK